MTRRSVVLFLFALAVLVTSCGGAESDPANTAGQSAAEGQGNTTPAAPGVDTSAQEANAASDTDEPAAAPAAQPQETVWIPRVGLSESTMIDGEMVTRTYEEGDLVYRNERYYVVAPRGYEGPPIFADRGPGEGVLANPVSPVAIPVPPAASDGYEWIVRLLESQSPMLIQGDDYVLIDEGADLGLDPTPAIDAASAQATFGSLERQWSGPVTGEMVCHYQPTEHLLAVLPNTMLGDSFRWRPGIEQSGCALVLPRNDGWGTVVINAHDVTNDPDFFYFEGDAANFPEPYFETAFRDRAGRSGEEVLGLGDRARRWIDSPDEQILQVRDGTTMWILTGPGAAELEPQHLVETALVLLAHFSSASRVDEPAMPLTNDERDRIDGLMQRRVDTRNAVLRGDQDRSALIDLYEHTDDASGAAPNYADGGIRQLQSTVLRAHRRSNTSMGDIIEVFACETENFRLASEDEFSSSSTGVERVRFSVETGRVIDERARYGAGQCDHGDDPSAAAAGVEVDFTEAELRAAMQVDMSDDGAFIEACIVERSFADIGFDKLVEWGVTPTQPQIGAGPFVSYSDADALAIAEVSTACGASAAAVWVGIKDELPPDAGALSCVTDALGKDRLNELFVSQIMATEFDPASLFADAEVAIDICS